MPDIKSLENEDLLDHVLDAYYYTLDQGCSEAACSAEREYPLLKAEALSRLEKPKSVWVLTREIYAYGQEGEYFEAVFGDKPTKEQLSEFLKLNDSPEALVHIDHILSGGGRIGNEYEWYFLREVTLHG